MRLVKKELGKCGQPTRFVIADLISVIPDSIRDLVRSYSLRKIPDQVRDDIIGAG